MDTETEKGESRPAGEKRVGRGRRKHRHWQVTVYYDNGEKFARVYVDKRRAEGFAERQKRSPVVKTARVTEVEAHPTRRASSGRRR